MDQKMLISVGVAWIFLAFVIGTIILLGPADRSSAPIVIQHRVNTPPPPHQDIEYAFPRVCVSESPNEQKVCVFNAVQSSGKIDHRIEYARTVVNIK